MFCQTQPNFANANRGSSYNRYLAIAARTVRRSLKETPRLNAERRGQMDLRFAKWEVSIFGIVAWIRLMGLTECRMTTERQAG